MKQGGRLIAAPTASPQRPQKSFLGAKKRGRTYRPRFIHERLFFSHLCKAIAAVNRAIFAGLERNFRLAAAGCTSSCEHLSLRSVLVFAGVAARFASLGLVFEASLCVEFLLTSGENEFVATFFAS